MVGIRNDVLDDISDMAARIEKFSGVLRTRDFVRVLDEIPKLRRDAKENLRVGKLFAKFLVDTAEYDMEQIDAMEEAALNGENTYRV